MNPNEFNALCGFYLIDPGIALENPKVLECLVDIRNTKDDDLKRGYINGLIRILETEF